MSRAHKRSGHQTKAQKAKARRAAKAHGKIHPSPATPRPRGGFYTESASPAMAIVNRQIT